MFCSLLQPIGEGYVAIVCQNLKNAPTACAGLLTQEQYTEAVARRQRAKQSETPVQATQETATTSPQNTTQECEAM